MQYVKSCLLCLQFKTEQHNTDYVATAVFTAVFLYYQLHIFHTAAMFDSGGDYINSSGVDTAVTENVGEFGNIFFNTVKHPCE